MLNADAIKANGINTRPIKVTCFELLADLNESFCSLNACPFPEMLAGPAMDELTLSTVCRM